MNCALRADTALFLEPKFCGEERPETTPPHEPYGSQNPVGAVSSDGQKFGRLAAQIGLSGVRAHATFDPLNQVRQTITHRAI